LLFDRDFEGTIALDTLYGTAPTADVSGGLIATLLSTVYPVVVNAVVGTTWILQ